MKCGRRVGKLYLPQGENFFRCRHCYDLTYQSCKERDKRFDEFCRLSPDALSRALESDLLFQARQCLSAQNATHHTD
jgi:hypothetical protein